MCDYCNSYDNSSFDDHDMKGKLCKQFSSARLGDHVCISSDMELIERSESKLTSPSAVTGRFRPSPHEQLFNELSQAYNQVTKDGSWRAVSAEFEDVKIDKELPTTLGTKIDLTMTKPLELKRTNDILEVVGRGTKLMKSMNFPTVIVKLLAGKLDKGKVYYVMLALDTAELIGEIPALMFSYPCAHKKTSFAEILPMGVIRDLKSTFVTPILQRKRYRRVFSKSCFFKIKSLIAGRGNAGCGGNLWNRYDLTRRSMQNLIKEVIELDISEMTLHFMNRILPLKHRTKKNKSLRSIKPSTHRKDQSGGNLVFEKGDLPKSITDSTRSHFTQSFEMLGLVRKVGGNFVHYREIPLIVNMGKEKKCDWRTTTLKTANSSVEQLDKYWCISDVT